MTEEPILITAPARSGTSLTAGLLATCCGPMWTGNTTEVTAYNPRGFFENAAMIDATTKRMLFEAHLDEMGQKPIPDADVRVPCNFDLRQTVEGLARHQGWTGGPWLIKEAKMVLTWEAWVDAFPNATWVICRRPVNQIIASCERAPFMFKRKGRDDWREWIDVHVARIKKLIEAAERVHIVNTHDIAAGNFDQIEAVADACGLDFDKSRASDFIMPEYWNRGMKDGANSDIASANLQ